MTREIKFRAQREDTKEWVYGYLVRYYNKFYICTDERREVEPGEFSFQRIDVISETIGEYTGLKDKNNKEIYEGDITLLHFEEEDEIKPIPMIVKFGKFNTGGGTNSEQVYGWYIFDKEVVYSLDNEIDIYEVIGDIYKNPELIKG